MRNKDRNRIARVLGAKSGIGMAHAERLDAGARFRLCERGKKRCDRRPGTAQRYLELSERYLREIEEELAAPGTAVNAQLTRGRDGIVQRLAETRAALAQLGRRNTKLIEQRSCKRAA